MRVPAAGRFSLFGLVVLALAALFAVAWLSKPVTVAAGQQAPAGAPAVATVSSGSRACPQPGAPGSRGTGVAIIAAAAQPGSGQPTQAGSGQASQAGSGQATVSRLSAGGGTTGSPLARLPQPGTLSLLNVPAAPGGSGTSSKNASAPAAQPGGVMVHATGAMAQGLEVEQTGAGGALTARCASPGTSFWFAAPGQQLTGVIKLYLMNVDSQASTVDVTIVTDTGPMQTGVDTGITVPPHGLVVQSLDSLVHGSRAIGLDVRTSVGRVVAALSESTKAGQAGQWLPPAQAPDRALVIPALPGTSGTRQLYVADPGGSDASVKLSVVAAGGTYQPAGAGVIDVPAGSASLISLPSLGGITGAAVLTSNVPITAAVMLPGGGGGAPGAMAVAAPALQEQGVVADAGQNGDTTTLLLSAPGAAARVRLATGASGLTAGRSGAASGAASGPAVATRVVTIPARHTVSVVVPRPPRVRQDFAIVLTPQPGSGPVYAGRVLSRTGGGVLAIMPVASALTSVRLPAVRAIPVTETP